MRSLSMMMDPPTNTYPAESRPINRTLNLKCVRHGDPDTTQSLIRLIARFRDVV